MPSWSWWFLLTGWAGATLLLAETPWFRVPPLVERLAPYVPTGPAGRLSGPRRHRAPTAGSLLEVVGPVATTVGDHLARLLGIGDDTAARLTRSGREPDVTAFRLRQAAWAGGALVAAATVAVVAPIPAIAGVALVLAAPALAALVLEQQLTNASVAWQQRVTHELPVVIEQLGMLLSSGSSLGAAVTRLGRRGNGACADELRLVAVRLRQGVGEMDALREWARRAEVPAVDRLVGVLALNWEASDLGALISAEARSVRRDVHRARLELIGRRAQQVWIPVTVATLLPGVILMAVPFVDAMRRLTGR